MYDDEYRSKLRQAFEAVYSAYKSHRSELRFRSYNAAAAPELYHLEIGQKRLRSDNTAPADPARKRSRGQRDTHDPAEQTGAAPDNGMGSSESMSSSHKTSQSDSRGNQSVGITSNITPGGQLISRGVSEAHLLLQKGIAKNRRPKNKGASHRSRTTQYRRITEESQRTGERTSHQNGSSQPCMWLKLFSFFKYFVS